MRRPAKNRATREPAIKNGRYGSSRVRFPIHAPLKPRATKTRGPRQHVEARTATKPPTRRAPEPVRSDGLLAASTLIYHSPAYSYLLLSKLGNEQVACAALCCNCAGPNAARAPASAGRQVSAARRRAFLPIGGGPVHTAASGFLADSRDRESH